MRQASILIFLMIQFLFPLSTEGQFIEKHNFSFKNSVYDIFSIKIDSSLRIIFVENKERSQQMILLDSLAKRFNSPFFSVTASIVDSLCQPLGLYINDNKKINSINLRSGIGNFHLKPNGVFSIDSSSNAHVIDAISFKESTIFSFAIQSGPMLLINGIINSTFDKNSKNRNTRCGVGIYADNNDHYLVFVKSLVPVTFYQFSELFQEKFNCKNALILESGSNCAMHLPSQRIDSNTQVLCRYIVIKL
jgi:uncharacterized protein YigE (DUF2233 family)